MPKWSEINLHPSLKRAILALGFTAPTEIQQNAMPRAIEGKDVVGVAETVSSSFLFVGFTDMSLCRVQERPSRTRSPFYLSSCIRTNPRPTGDLYPP